MKFKLIYTKIKFPNFLHFHLEASPKITSKRPQSAPDEIINEKKELNIRIHLHKFIKILM